MNAEPSLVAHLQRIEDNCTNSILRHMEMEAPPYHNNWTMAAVPHIVQIADSGYLAINKYCSVKGKQILTRQPKSCQEHVIKETLDSSEDEALEDLKDTKILNMIQEFLGLLKLSNVYEFNISDALDNSGQYSPFSLLAAFWKCTAATENGIDDEIDLCDIMKTVIRKFEIEVAAPSATFKAILQGSQESIQLLSEDKGIATTVASVERFNEKYDLIFARTNLHSSDYKPELSGTIQKTVLLHEAFEEEESNFETSPVPIFMTHCSRDRLSVPGKSNEIEQDCHFALQNLHDKNSIIEGFESQKGGVLIVLKKNQFANDELVETIANSIASYSRANVISVKFELLELSMGMSVVTRDNIAKYKPQKRAVVIIEKPSQTQTLPKDHLEDESMKGESQREPETDDDNQGPDDTYDE